MSRESILILLGVLFILSPFVGLPLYVLAWVLPALGLAVAGIGVSLRSRRRHREQGESIAIISTEAHP
jgi:uncharacterized membrane protein